MLLFLQMHHSCPWSLIFCSFGDSKYALFISITIHPLTHTSSQKTLNWFNHIACFSGRIFPVLVFPVFLYGNFFLFSLISLGIKHNLLRKTQGAFSNRNQGRMKTNNSTPHLLSNSCHSQCLADVGSELHFFLF